MSHCIGWHDPDGCPHFGGEHHGCRHPEEHRHRDHVCACGAKGGVVRPRRPRRARCGTPSGYERHRNEGEDACTECKAAHARAESERYRRRQLRKIA